MKHGGLIREEIGHLSLQVCGQILNLTKLISRWSCTASPQQIGYHTLKPA
jgi:hypothetical protein